MVDNFVAAPALILTELLTITDVIGMPPTKPEKIFPIPCATNSLFGDAFRL